MTSFLHATIIAGTPLFLSTLGEILNEKAGNLNLGVEGMMLMGAVAGFLAAKGTNNAFLAILCSILFGCIGALIYAFLTITLRANQTVTGLALTIFGSGISSFIGQNLSGKVVPDRVKYFLSPIKLPLLGDIPFLGKVFFTQDIIVYFSYILAFAAAFYFYKTRIGLNLKAVGENPYAADAVSINVALYKYVNILAGGALCGLSGGYLSLIYVPAWQNNITSGRGWIAVALVIFAAWNPCKALLGAYLFGGLDIIGFRIQDGFISKYFLDMLPYLVTIIILTLFSFKRSKKNSPPKFLGLPYFREER
ncbi:nucleoside ABC transporter membrane protein [Caloramator quimbayensis]|uniref:Nucleoside ABC transporter membrane protein n=1 Tax=Caloramator quimbayensis TaxID=1147123 RepID=A0A1T4WJK2_9CLOT|nr:ABC transporter permease [Caloramator quimbayensis]SKA77357.1 nucleoside ABC transporter membrane protein [Caloramator quimbayensis]